MFLQQLFDIDFKDVVLFEERSHKDMQIVFFTFILFQQKNVSVSL